MLTLNYINSRNHRTYRLVLESDLLGDLVLARYNGSTINRQGGRHLEYMPNLETGLSSFIGEHNRRTKHKYRVNS